MCPHRGHSLAGDTGLSAMELGLALVDSDFPTPLCEQGTRPPLEGQYEHQH